MSSILASLDVANDAAPEIDSVGGSGPWESGLYHTKVAMAFLRKAASGAMGLHLHLTDIDSGRELRQVVYISSGDAKGNKTYYEKDGQRRNLPGFSLFRSLTLMTAGKEPTTMETEDKVVSVYSPEAKAEVPTTVPVLTDLLGKEILAGVLRQIEDKNVKNDAGVYVPSGETRENNEIDKFFHVDTRLTVAEAQGGATEGKFIDTWVEKNTGQVRDRTTKTPAAGAPAGAQSSVFSGAAAPAQTPKPAASLFG